MINYSSKQLLEKYINMSQLDIYLDLVEKANRSFNLFSRNLERDDLMQIIADSLIPVKLGWIKNDDTILDIGSGWGIPSIPFLLAISKLEITLAERSNKKADFLALALNRLGLEADIRNCDLSQISNKNNYSLVVSRRISLDGKIFPDIKKLASQNTRLIHYGLNFPADLYNLVQMIDYKLDNSSLKRITLAEI
ncbi:MAG: RsmG family class I SAM-dependent methyltransferase [candidate division Zixibacteria bacterium]